MVSEKSCPPSGCTFNPSHLAQISPTQKTNNQEDADKAQRKLGYPSQSYTLGTPGRGLRGLGGISPSELLPLSQLKEGRKSEGEGEEKGA